MRNSHSLNLDSYHSKLDFADTLVKVGTIRRAIGLIIESLGPPVPVGTVCEIPSVDGGTTVPADRMKRIFPSGFSATAESTAA